MVRRILWAMLLWPALAASATGEARPLAVDAVAPLLPQVPGMQRARSASLFVAPGEGGVLAPGAARRAPAPAGRPGRDVAQLLDLIARAEAGAAGYDAVQHGARIPPPRAPTRMTLGEIRDWIAETPGQPHAIGRYQFIPPTLERVARLRGYGSDVRFTARVQDDLALVLLEEAGLAGFRAGQIDRRSFMAALARIWAGLPLPNGRSYYHGHAGNRATMSWAEFDAGMARIWPVG
jgi:hypothetical protein